MLRVATPKRTQHNQILKSATVCSLYSPLPHSKTLIVRRADKATILINKGDGVDSSQVTVVLLNHLTCPDVPLTERHREAEREEVNTLIYDTMRWIIKMDSQNPTKLVLWQVSFSSGVLLNKMFLLERRETHIAWLWETH